MTHAVPLKTDEHPPRGHRLGVIHFLLWMLGCAAAVTGYRIFTDWSMVPVESVTFVRLTHLGMGMAYGVGLVTAYVLVCSVWRRDGTFPVHPGHWMLLLGLAAALLDGVTTLAVRGLVKIGWVGQWEEWYIIQTVGFAAGSLVILAVLFRARVTWPWRAVWLMILLLAVSRSVLWLFLWRGYRQGAWVFSHSLPANVEAAFMAAGAAALGIAIASDAAVGTRRDWLHWTGVAVWLAMAAVELAICWQIFWAA